MKVKNISKSFDGKTVLSNFSYDFNAGKIYCIIGESGIGKTTLWRILAGLELADTGEITERFEKVSYIFQDDRLLNTDAVTNITAVNVDVKTAEKYLDLVGLREDKKKKPAEMSGGMKRRLCIARALSIDADLYLFDEPFSALDQATAENMARLIKNELVGKMGIIVTHNLDCAAILADEMIEIT
jgi:NitT/TauT family transport system ATP-binding protein